MGSSYVIQLWLISTLVCYTSVSCQDIEPGTFEPEIFEETTPFGPLSTTIDAMSDTTIEILTTTVETSTTVDTTSDDTTLETTTAIIETTSKGMEASTDENTSEVTTTEKTTTLSPETPTEKPPCPQPECYYKLTQTNFLWIFTKTCCLQCCILEGLPYQKCRVVNLGICGYPVRIRYFVRADNGYSSDSSYSYY